MVSISQTAPTYSEIINENASTGDAWIRHRKQSMWHQTSSTKMILRVTHGFDSANSPCGLRNLQRNCFHWWRMHSTAQTAHVGLEIINQTESLTTRKCSTKMIPRVTHGFDSANSPYLLRNHQRKCFHGWRMHSTVQTAPVASEIFNETASTGDASIRHRKQPLRPQKIINETASTGDAWIRVRKQSMWHQTSSTKMIPRVTHGFDSANSPCDLRNLQRNCFHWWRMHSTAQTAHVGLEIINDTESLATRKSSTKLLSRVTHGFESANSPCGIRHLQRKWFHGWRMDSTAQTAPAASEIFNETASTCDAWIRHRKQPLRPQKSSTKLLPRVTHRFDIANSPCSLRNLQQNCFHWWRMHSTAQTAHVGLEIINDTESLATRKSSTKLSTGDAWIRERKQSMWHQTSSTKMIPRVTHGFDSANSPCGLRNLQRNCFHWGRMHSTAQTAPAASEIFNETASTGDAWIRQRKQPLRPQKSSMKLLRRVTHAFDSANSPCGPRNLQRNCFHWWRKHWTAQTAHGLQKSSTKLLPRVTHAFDSANSPCGLRNLQRNCFHWWHMHSTSQIAPTASEIFNETAFTGDACIRQRKELMWA